MKTTNTTKLFDEYSDATKDSKCCFEFGGFYQGLHQVIVESAVDRAIVCFNIENSTDIDYYDHDYDHDTTINNYTVALLKAIDKELNTNFLECNFKLVSPNEYNFSTDFIEFEKSKMNQALKELVYQDDARLQALLDDVNFCNELEFEVAGVKNAG